MLVLIKNLGQLSPHAISFGHSMLSMHAAYMTKTNRTTAGCNPNSLQCGSAEPAQRQTRTQQIRLLLFSQTEETDAAAGSHSEFFKNGSSCR